MSGAASTVINPIVRFVLPDLELGTVMEEESVYLETDDAEHNIRRREKQCKRFSHYKRKGMENDTIRKDVVGDGILFLLWEFNFDIFFLLKIGSLNVD